MMRKVGLIGGGFDPIHNGHLAAAAFAQHTYDLDVVLFAPTFESPVQKRYRAAFSDRCTMAKLAVKDQPSWNVTEAEKILPKPNFTINLVKHIKELCFDPDIYLIVGADQANDFHKWHSAAELAELVQPVVLTRQGLELSLGLSKWGFKYLNPIRLDISSTKIRVMAENEEDLIGLVPPEVQKYIEKNYLYGLPF